MNVPKYIIIIIILLIPGISLYAQNVKNDSVYGYGICDFSSYEKLLRGPVKVSAKAVNHKSADNTVMSSDYHMLSTIPVEVLAQKLVDLDAAQDVFSRIAESVDLTPENSILVQHRQEIYTTYQFLGFGPDYRYRVEVNFDSVMPDIFEMRWQLYDKMKSTIEDLKGTWFLQKIKIKDTEYTYIRSTAETVIKNPPAGLAVFVNLFGESEIKTTFKDLLKSVETQ